MWAGPETDVGGDLKLMWAGPETDVGGDLKLKCKLEWP